MSAHSSSLPFLPGFNLNTNLGRTNFRRNSIFGTYNGIRLLTDKPESIGTIINTRYPSIYARGEVAELPSWIAFDNKYLAFEAYYQETLHEVLNSPFQIRACKIYFFLEDGTVKVIEPKVENSGIPQGTLISRQRISFPSPKDNLFYDIIDFNIGREIEFYGKVFKITNCDKFTRNFLNRLGIPVPDPILTPENPYLVLRKEEKDRKLGKRPYEKEAPLAQFVKYDGQILRFYGYWDDRGSEDGTLHNVTVLYFLGDDTIQVLEERNKNSGNDSGPILVKRVKVPKFTSDLPTPGATAKETILNVLGSSLQEARYTKDPLNCGKYVIKYYKEQDLAIGATINVFSRNIVLVDCDLFTKNFYRTKYGIDNFTPIERPHVEKPVEVPPVHKRKLPPWNGIGSFKDSAQSCYSVVLKTFMKDLKQFVALDKYGLDSRTLRFKSHLKSKIPENCIRRFVVNYFLADNTISIFELAQKDSGCFLRRFPIKIPGQERFTSELPDYYLPQHMYTGATVNLNGFTFVLTDADEYTLRYMELHPDQFPKSNINIVLPKVREKLLPICKDFVAKNVPKDQPVISYDQLSQELCAIMGDDWTEHEMITLARHFSAVCKSERFSRGYIRQIVLSELKKILWDDLERFKEYFHKWDVDKTGYLPKKEVYTLVKACKLPFDNVLIEQMLNVLATNDKCEIEGNDMFLFLDRNHCPVNDLVPLNIKKELWWASEVEPVAGKLIDWCAFIDGLDIGHLLKEPTVLKK